jgi:hypothetical protein
MVAACGLRPSFLPSLDLDPLPMAMLSYIWFAPSKPCYHANAWAAAIAAPCYNEVPLVSRPSSRRSVPAPLPLEGAWWILRVRTMYLPCRLTNLLNSGWLGNLIIDCHSVTSIVT